MYISNEVHGYVVTEDKSNVHVLVFLSNFSTGYRGEHVALKLWYIMMTDYMYHGMCVTFIQ